MITASALVLFMVPGLALFYGGMVNSKNVVNMLMMNVVTIPIATIIWVVVGFSLAFGASAGGLGIIGDLDKVGLAGLGDEETLFSVFQMMFAIITPALIAGAVAGRMKFSSWVIFTALWSLLIYPVVAHWGFAGDGWLLRMGRSRLHRRSGHPHQLWNRRAGSHQGAGAPTGFRNRTPPHIPFPSP